MMAEVKRTAAVAKTKRASLQTVNAVRGDLPGARSGGMAISTIFTACCWQSGSTAEVKLRQKDPGAAGRRAVSAG